jgi:hypothetical protein
LNGREEVQSKKGVIKMAKDEYKAIIQLITASRDGESDILEKLQEWYGLDMNELVFAQNQLANLDSSGITNLPPGYIPVAG